MSEEEKKAIEELEDFIEDNEIQNISVFTAKKIKNIIDNQQKEIKEKTTIIMAGAEKVKQLEKEIGELKEKNGQLTNYLNDSYYVSADKIREKIKEYREETMRCQERKDYENANINQRILLAFDNLLEEK